MGSLARCLFLSLAFSLSCLKYTWLRAETSERILGPSELSLLCSWLLIKPIKYKITFARDLLHRMADTFYVYTHVGVSIRKFTAK